MRPEENARLRWESIAWHNGQHGTLQVTHGKTAAARRMLPLSPHVRKAPRGTLVRCKSSTGGLGMGVRDKERPRRTIHTQKAAP